MSEIVLGVLVSPMELRNIHGEQGSMTVLQHISERLVGPLEGFWIRPWHTVMIFMACNLAAPFMLNEGTDPCKNC